MGWFGGTGFCAKWRNWSAKWRMGMVERCGFRAKWRNRSAKWRNWSARWRMGMVEGCGFRAKWRNWSAKWRNRSAKWRILLGPPVSVGFVLRQVAQLVETAERSCTAQYSPRRDRRRVAGVHANFVNSAHGGRPDCDAVAMPSTNYDGPIRWGIVATGGIAAQAVADLALLRDAQTVAVASRTHARAAAFAAEHDIPRAYGSYEEIVHDPEVDAIYVATPHAQHYTISRQAIEAGKPLLIEKAFTCTHAAAADLVGRARKNNVFVMEAMWMRFQPGIHQMRTMIEQGVIGEVRWIQGDLGFVNDIDLPRLVDPAAGGGILLDCGVYLVQLSQWLLGRPSTVTATGRLGETGVDVEAGVLLGYAEGAHAALSCSFTSDCPGAVTIVGTEGHITIEPRFHHTSAIRIARRGTAVQVLANPLIGTGLAHEFDHVGQCLRAGLAESPIMPLDDTLDVMAILDVAVDMVGAPHVDEGFTPAR